MLCERRGSADLASTSLPHGTCRARPVHAKPPLRLASFFSVSVSFLSVYFFSRLLLMRAYSGRNRSKRFNKKNSIVFFCCM